MENKVICFHNPDEENGYLSNWYLSEFREGEHTFSSMEQYMMYSKAVTFGDTESAAKILETQDVAEIKALGRGVRNYNDTVWNGIRQIVIYRGLLQKFSQNEELKAALLATGDSLLCECAYRDRIWGIGRRMNDPERLQMETWQGQNLLGFALMQVRDELRKAE